MEIHIGEKYGCLEILDEGTDFLNLIAAKIERINDEKAILSMKLLTAK